MMKEKRGIVNQQNAGLFLFVASLLAFIGPHSRMYCGYALYSPVYYLPVSHPPCRWPVHASPQPLEQIKLSESQLSGRVGMIEMDLASGRTVTAWRADERFPMMSTFKVVLCGAVLARVDAGDEQLERKIHYRQQDLVDYSPVSEKHLADGMGGRQASAPPPLPQAITAPPICYWPPSAAPQLTAFLRQIGDNVTRLDRWETELNEALPGDAPHHYPGQHGRDPTQAADQPASGRPFATAAAAVDGGRSGRRTVDPAPCCRRAGFIADKTGAGERGARGIVALLGPNNKAERIW